jgi:hypothetical protein
MSPSAWQRVREQAPWNPRIPLPGRTIRTGSGLLLEALDGLDYDARQAITEVIGLHREFPAWAVWLPNAGRTWTAVRMASARAPSPDLPTIWVRAATTAELTARMASADAQDG